ncbi:MAG TPA: 1-acyl-sn-glycerol-3-phosphate acyltransferase [Anaerolineae bacterium]|nr:1-acyl-sn-glycerol-3-phosphate acyltransferase [Anaerolineae bacterium]
MKPPHATAAELRRAINSDILEAVGLSPASPLRAALRPLVWPPVHSFARVAAEFDRHVAQSGLMDAIRWVLPRFVDGVRAHGAENIPATGPLVVASNHPGASDGLAIASCLPRDDLKVVVTDRPFFRGLHAASSYLIYTPRDTAGRMGVVREAIRHLRSGGSLLIFAHGHVEPDPEVAPGAEEALEKWSPSVPLFLRQVPGAHLVITIVSGVLAPSVLRNPLTRLREDWQGRQLLAEFVQIAQQTLVNRRFELVPTVRFGAPLSAGELLAGRDLNAALAAILDRARELLADI